MDGAIYEFLGMRTGVVVPGMNPRDKRDAYAADVIYATNNELGFDYLRDNMAFSNADRMQQALNFAIVDEVDSILIDEAVPPSSSPGRPARTPICTSASTRSFPDWSASRRKKARAITGSTRSETGTT